MQFPAAIGAGSAVDLLPHAPGSSVNVRIDFVLPVPALEKLAKLPVLIRPFRSQLTYLDQIHSHLHDYCTTERCGKRWLPCGVASLTVQKLHMHFWRI